MSLHADESAVPRQRSREQPSRPAEGKKPATISQLRRSSPLACWRYQWTMDAIEIVDAHHSPVILGRPRSVTPGPASSEINPDHDGASTSPGLAVVLSAAVTSPALRSGARYGLLPRIGRRHFFHYPSRDSAEALPFVVAHRSALLLRLERDAGDQAIDDGSDGLRSRTPQLVRVARHEGDPLVVRPIRDVAGEAEHLRRQKRMRDLQGFHPSLKRILHLPASLFAAHRHLSAKTRRCASESLPAGRPSCSVKRTWAGGLPTCRNSIPRIRKSA